MLLGDFIQPVIATWADALHWRPRYDGDLRTVVACDIECAVLTREEAVMHKHLRAESHYGPGATRNIALRTQFDSFHEAMITVSLTDDEQARLQSLLGDIAARVAAPLPPST